MTNVVNLRAHSRLVFVCGACGCSTFYLYNDHTTECAACGGADNGGEWVTPIEDRTKSPEKDNGSSVNVIGVGSVEFAKRRVLKSISAMSDDLCLVAGWSTDGAMKAWSDYETAAQRDWLARKLRELAASFEAKPLPE